MGVPERVIDPGEGPCALLAAEFRRYRRLAGLTQLQLADTVKYSAPLVGLVEITRRFPQEDFVHAVDEAVGAHGGLVNCWKLARAAKLPAWARPLVELERAAVAMRIWEPLAITGLLQTADYARALIRAARVCDDDARVEELVQARLARQEILERTGEERTAPLLWVIVDEAVLRRPVGGRAVMHDQLRHLLAMTARPTIVVQVLPLAVGAHAGQNGSFTVFEMDDAPSIAWVEGVDGGHAVDDESRVAEYALKYDHLRADALSPTASRALIAAVLASIKKDADAPRALPAAARPDVADLQP